ncbi:hypothetical protein [Gemmata palustris]|nr:hypothetical protein [Gemmata palustris]
MLRYVNDFGQMAASKDQIWLILEDMWIQRSLLEGSARSTRTSQL